MTYTPKTTAERWFRSTARMSARGNKRRSAKGRYCRCLWCIEGRLAKRKAISEAHRIEINEYK